MLSNTVKGKSHILRKIRFYDQVERNAKLVFLVEPQITGRVRDLNCDEKLNNFEKFVWLLFKKADGEF